MNKPQFLFNYITTFCASWVAQNYSDCCQMDQHDRLEKPPMEDAMILAEAAWALYQEHHAEAMKEVMKSHTSMALQIVEAMSKFAEQVAALKPGEVPPEALIQTAPKIQELLAILKRAVIKGGE